MENPQFLTHPPQLSPEIFDPRKMDSNFLEANFEYFGLSTARDDKNSVVYWHHSTLIGPLELPLSNTEA